MFCKNHLNGGKIRAELVLVLRYIWFRSIINNYYFNEIKFL